MSDQVNLYRETVRAGVEPALTAADLEAMGYIHPRQLPNGEWLAVQKMLFTAGLFIVVDEWTWRTRFCYEHMKDALVALKAWNGEGDPPGPWIKQKPEDRLGPGALGPI